MASHILLKVIMRLAIFSLLIFTIGQSTARPLDPDENNPPDPVPIEYARANQFWTEWNQEWFSQCESAANKNHYRGDERKNFYIECLSKTHITTRTVWGECLDSAASLKGIERGKSISDCVSKRGGTPRTDGSLSRWQVMPESIKPVPHNGN